MGFVALYVNLYQIWLCVPSDPVQSDRSYKDCFRANAIVLLYEGHSTSLEGSRGA